MPSKQSTSTAPAMSFAGTVKRALSSADTSSIPVSVDTATGTFQVVMITATPVRRLIDDPRNPGQKILVDEVIVPEGVDLSPAQAMPLVDGYNTDAGLGAVVGKHQFPDRINSRRATSSTRRATAASVNL